MHDHVTREVPIEACGLVAGRENESAHIYEITNEAGSPIRYRMAPKEQLAAFLELEQRGWNLLAIYHSHPAGPTLPSTLDLAEAAYPNTAQLIWSPDKGDWRCRAFSFEDSGALEIKVHLLGKE